jgi:hypothetical protein
VERHTSDESNNFSSRDEDRDIVQRLPRRSRREREGDVPQLDFQPTSFLLRAPSASTEVGDPARISRINRRDSLDLGSNSVLGDEGFVHRGNMWEDVDDRELKVGDRGEKRIVQQPSSVLGCSSELTIALNCIGRKARTESVKDRKRGTGGKVQRTIEKKQVTSFPTSRPATEGMSGSHAWQRRKKKEAHRCWRPDLLHTRTRERMK